MADKNNDITRKIWVCYNCGDDTSDESGTCNDCHELNKKKYGEKLFEPK